jgi:branched-chain amino acid transport system ATP-binding protein
VEGVRAGYGELEVLHGVSLQVAPGEAVALLGSNGAGKTTLLRVISGLLPYRGSVRWRGEELAGVAPHERARRGIAHIPEGRGILHSLTVQENLELGALFGAARARRRENMEAMFELFPILRERRRQLAGTLSGGQQQMLAIARALMSEPELLLVDEPSLGLAPVVIEEVVQALQAVRSRGASLLLVEQNLSVALRVVDRGYVLENGVVAFQGTRSELEHSEQVRAAYLSV